MDKHFNLVLEALYSLTTHWRNYLATEAETLFDLSAQERNVLNNAEPIFKHITLDNLQILYPYLPQDRARQILNALVAKDVLEAVDDGVFRQGSRLERYQRDTIQAIMAFVETLTILPVEQANRLAILSTALVDRLAQGPNAIPTPIFNMAYGVVASSEHPLGQVQQRLLRLLTYHDDAHIAAWRGEAYSPAAARVAGHLIRYPQGISLDTFLKSPLFYDEAYVLGALDELAQRGEVLNTGVGYALTAKGVMQREHVEYLTSEYFASAIETHLSEEARKEWIQLLSALIDLSKKTTNLLD